MENDEKMLVISLGPGKLYLIAYKSDTVDEEMIEDAFASYLEYADYEDRSYGDIVAEVMFSFAETGELSYRWVPFYHIAN